MKYLPPELKDWYFPFNWDVKQLWELDAKVCLTELDSFIWHLEQPLWSSVQGKGMLFDLSPGEVLDNPDKYPFHAKRIKDSSLEYPLIICDFQGREIIMDGLHRFVKAVQQKEKIIKIKLVNQINVQKIAFYE